MTDAAQLPSKKDVARALLLKGTVFVHLDPRLQGVCVPSWWKRQPQLVLQIGLDMPVPIPDLRVDDVGVYGTLSFNRAAFTCVVPWDAVFALVGDDGRHMIWPDSIPKEIAAEIEREARRTRVGSSEDGAIVDAPSPRAAAARPATKRKRRARPQARPPAEPAASVRPKPASAAPKPLELIAGEGAASPAPRSERRVPPPYLRLVK